MSPRHMRSRNILPFERRVSPRGAALLAFLALLVLGGLSWFLHLATGFNRASVRDPITDRALAEAKDALLGYAAAYPETHLRNHRAAFVPGHLPCPDTGNALENEGAEAGTCGAKGVTVIGHFPWRSLGIPPPKDGYGECLWYAVSGNYKANPKADLLNPDIPGQFQVVDAEGRILAGEGAAERPVAILFAPGPPLAGQERAAARKECRGDYDARQFLDALGGIDNAQPHPEPEGVTRVIAGQEGARFNDRLLWIGQAELFARVEGRLAPEDLFDANASPQTRALTQRAAACLARFGDNNTFRRLPWAAAIALDRAAPDTFENDAFSDSKNRSGGRLPMLVKQSRTTLDPTWGTFAECAAKDSACRLMRSDNCPELLPVAGYPTPADGSGNMDSPDGWLDKWKDHLFYLVAPGFAPAKALAADCALTPEDCLLVNGQPYAAVLIFAGAPLPGQTRANPADRQAVANYLEGDAVTAIETGGRILNVTGNDRVVCLLGPDAMQPAFRVVPDCQSP